MNAAPNPLEALRPIHAAPLPELWPPAPGWWVLAVLLAGLLAATIVWCWRRYRQYRFRNKVLLEVDSITSSYSKDNSSEFLTNISTLLRRIALRRYPAERVASLTGSAWLQFLDSTGGGGAFSNGVGQLLESGPYSPTVDSVPVAELAALVRRWAKHNLGSAA